MSIEVATLLLTAVCALFAAIPALQGLGVNVQVFGRSTVPTSPPVPLSKARWWTVLVIACLALVGSIVGLVMHALNHHEFTLASQVGAWVSWQKPIHSDDPRFPFGLEVGIRTNQEYVEPAQLFIMCDGDIGDAHGIRLMKGGDLQAINEAIMVPPASWYHPEVFNLKWRAPLWKPDDPLIVRFYSKTRIQAKYAVPIIFRPNQ